MLAEPAPKQPKSNPIKVTKLMTAFLSNQHYELDYFQPVISQTEIGEHLTLNIGLKNINIEQAMTLNELFLDKMVDELAFDDYKNLIINFIPANN